MIEEPQALGPGEDGGNPAAGSGNGSAAGERGGGLAPAPAIVLSPRDRWLRERLDSVGSSELAAVLEEDPRRGALAVFTDKVARKISEEDETWLTFGRDVEAATMRGYSRKTGRPLVPRRDGFAIIRHPDLPILSATPDGFTLGSETFPAPADGVGALEAKAVGFHRREEWQAEPPLYFVIQVQAQMGCAQLAWGSLAALMGGISIADPVDLVRDDAFLGIALEAVERFWWHVRNRIPPEADAKPGTRAAIRRLWTPTSEQTIVLEREAVAIADAWAAARARKDAAEEDERLAFNQLAVRMGEAGVGYLPDGSSFILSARQLPERKCACGRRTKREYTRVVGRRWWPNHLKER